MKNIHILPTNKPSRLANRDSNNKLEVSEKNTLFVNGFGFTPQNIYIISSEEIKEGDYVTNGKYVSQAINEWWTKFYIGNPELESDYWKIILTTDQDLIKDGIQSIDDEFLEWFVKNPSCEEVEIISLEKRIGSYDGKGSVPIYVNIYAIIIPKEEPNYNMKQEKSYSEEDLEYAFEQGKLNSNICYRRTFKNVLEILQFKKK